MRILWLIFIIFSGIVSTQTMAADVAVPELQKQVTDLTGTLTEAEQRALTEQVQKLAPAQIAILIVPTTGEETVEQYATRVFDRWKLGDAQRSDGVLFLVAWQDHTVRIEVGYGLEGALTDLQSSEIIRTSILPAFRENKLAQGLTQGVTHIGALVRGEAPPVQHTSAAASGTDNLIPDGMFSEIWFGALFIVPAWIFSKGNILLRGLKSGVAITAIGWLYSFFFTAESYSLVRLLIMAVISTFAIVVVLLLGALGFTRGGGGGGFRGGGGGFGGGGGGFRGGGGSSGGGGASGRW